VFVLEGKVYNNPAFPGHEPQGVEVAWAVIGVTAGLDEERA
jgi:hypothetical protein